MTVEKDQDETSDFVCESEDVTEVEVESQEVEVKEEQASSEATNTDDDASKEVETKVDTKDESTDKKETDSLGDNTTADDSKPKKRDGYQKSIDRVTRQREDVKRENEALKREMEELKGKQNKPEDKGEIKEPVEDDFETYDKYLDALDKFDKQPDQKGEKEIATEKKDTDSQAAGELTDSQKTAMAITQERVDSADKPEDFDAVALSPDVDITGDMLEALAECDDPAKVMYHLGKNKDLATQIANKTPAQQMREIAKLDLAKPSKPDKPTKLTKAPDAIDPVNGSDSQKKSHTEMSFAEFEADDRARNKGKKSTW
jgi:hypothetical protein